MDHLEKEMKKDQTTINVHMSTQLLKLTSRVEELEEAVRNLLTALHRIGEHSFSLECHQIALERLIRENSKHH